MTAVILSPVTLAALLRNTRARLCAVVVSLDCYSGAWDRRTPWAPRDKYWDRDEVYRRGNGVSAAIHYHGSDAATMTQLFVDTLEPVVDACIAQRPPIRPEQQCDEPRVLPGLPVGAALREICELRR